jgi:SAM-dependent methyltransferase
MSSANLYDEIPYRTVASPTTHPGRFATIAALFGVKSAPPERCRVLEIGCGDANNLVPMAFSLPKSTFVGIDLAAAPIAAGMAFADRAGLRNLTLQQKNLLDLTPEFGTFDYIIAHGLYAWVPMEVREKLMAVCRSNLAPGGVAYVSYNTYPGCRLREVAREMALYLTGAVEDPFEREKRARKFLGLLRRPRPVTGDNGAIVSKWTGRLFDMSRDALIHDDLTETYRPVYFHEFAEHAARHRLQYLGEAEYREMDDRLLAPEEAEALRDVAGQPRVVREQYLDFLRLKGFRQTLLCREEDAVAPRAQESGLKKLFVTTRARVTTKTPDFAGDGEVEFRTTENISMKTGHRAIKSVLKALDDAWPHPVRFEELPAEGVSPQELSEFILSLYSSWLLELSVSPPSFVRLPGPRPSTSKLCRLQIERRDLVTNGFHEDVRMDGELTKAIVGLLDGTRDREELLRGLLPIDPKMNAEALEAGLIRLAGLALLTA